MGQLQQLLDAAFDTAPAQEANTAISRVRDEVSGRLGGPAWSYEVLVPEKGGEAFLVKETLPRLIYFMNSRGSVVGAEMFLSLFAGDVLHFIAVPDALAVLVQWSGMSLDDMKARWAEGFGQAPLMLPGPQK